MLQLYHHGSSACAAKVRFALYEKQLAWVSRYVDILNGDQFKSEFLALNPKAVVPVLIHQETVIRESTVICEFLEEVFPEHPIYPRSPQQRAEVRIWTKAVDEELHPACSAITYIVSHRHTILRNGIGGFEQFMQQGETDGAAARALKWTWIQQGLFAPGAADKIRLYDRFLEKMEQALEGSEWLVANRFSMADIAMTPYVNRLDALAMDPLWRNGRRPRVEGWFDRIRARPTFKPALLDWMPSGLAAEMRANGKKSWPEIRTVLGLT